MEKTTTQQQDAATTGRPASGGDGRPHAPAEATGSPLPAEAEQHGADADIGWLFGASEPPVDLQPFRAPPEEGTIY